jgi:hypothetical protein
VGQLDAGKLDGVSGADLADDFQRIVGAEVDGVTSVSIAGGAIEGRLIAISQHRPAQNAAEGVGKRDSVNSPRMSEANRGGVFADFGGGFREGQD